MRKEKDLMMYINQNFTKEPSIHETLFDKTGNQMNDDEKNKITHYAKRVENTDSDQLTHYIRIYQGIPLDPMGPYARRERVLETKMKRVSKNTFDLYLTYLKTNNSIYLTKAQRGMLNE